MRFTLGPQRKDVALAGVVAVASQLEVWLNAGIHPRTEAALLELALALALIWRRRAPLATTVFVCIAGTAEAIAGVPLDQPLVPLLTFVIAIYSLVIYATRERALLGTAILLVSLAIQTTSQHRGVGNFIFPLVFVGGAWAAGRTIHARTTRAEDLERDQNAHARTAVEEERRRIARELHDVISHSLGVLVLQAGAAEQVLANDPEQVRGILRSIRATGQEALAEVGTMLALVRGEAEALREPQPSLADLDGLVARMRESGLRVDLGIDGQRCELPAALELSAYRIVQEGLTNVLKHAGPAQAHVHLRYAEHDLELEVSDNGAGATNGGGSRRGLAGIGERVEVFGGRFEAGPRPEGGWALRAALPLPR
jgi:signal transduction histidine kinase